MAIVANTLIGKTSGSVGGTTFSTWKGKNVLKSKPSVVANPRTPAQQAQRNAHAMLVALFRILAPILILGFKELAVGMSQFNAFMSYNLKNAIDKAGAPVAALIPANFKISQGTISDTPITSAEADFGANNITVSYPSSVALPGQVATDKTLVILYNETRDVWVSNVAGAARSDGSVSFDIPADWSDINTIHCYLGFSSIDGSIASDSVRADVTAQS